MATKKNDREKWLETVKFVGRYVLLIGGPLLLNAVADLEGTWGELFGQILPVVLPYLDKWVHNNNDIPVNGIVPF